MRKARINNFDLFVGELTELEKGKRYEFKYSNEYDGPPVSLTMPTTQRNYSFDIFPPFFEGLLPEGIQLEALLRKTKIDRNDLFSILIVTGKDLVGSVTVEEIE